MNVWLIGEISFLENKLKTSKNPKIKEELHKTYLNAVVSSIGYYSSCKDTIMKECFKDHSISYLGNYASSRFGEKKLKKLFGENERQRNDMIKNAIYNALDNPNICKILENAIMNQEFSEVDNLFLNNAKIQR